MAEAPQSRPGATKPSLRRVPLPAQERCRGTLRASVPSVMQPPQRENTGSMTLPRRRMSGAAQPSEVASLTNRQSTAGRGDLGLGGNRSPVENKPRSAACKMKVCGVQCEAAVKGALLGAVRSRAPREHDCRAAVPPVVEVFNVGWFPKLVERGKSRRSDLGVCVLPARVFLPESFRSVLAVVSPVTGPGMPPREAASESFGPPQSFRSAARPVGGAFESRGVVPAAPAARLARLSRSGSRRTISLLPSPSPSVPSRL